MTNDEYRIKEFFLFYLLKKQSEATSAIRHSSFHEVSYKRRLWLKNGQSNRERNFALG